MGEHRDKSHGRTRCSKSQPRPCSPVTSTLWRGPAKSRYGLLETATHTFATDNARPHARGPSVVRCAVRSYSPSWAHNGSQIRPSIIRRSARDTSASTAHAESPCPPIVTSTLWRGPAKSRYHLPPAVTFRHSTTRSPPNNACLFLLSHYNLAEAPEITAGNTTADSDYCEEIKC